MKHDKVTAVLSVTEGEILRKEAARRDMTVSKLLRTIIRKSLKMQKP